MRWPAAIDEEDMPSTRPSVLLAEDHDGLREALVTMLETAGFRVLAASEDGAGLLRVAETIEPDVVLVDLRMPSVSGIDVARWMKGLWPTTPVVVYSAYGEDAFMKSAASAGVFAYLVKGCPPSSLMRTLRLAVAHKKTEDDLLGQRMVVST
jgi:DNA-binding NarL/FixJ family response regulator